MPRLYRLLVPVPDLEAGVAFYASLLGLGGERVSTDRHYFPCDSMILAVVTPAAEGRPYKANPEITYIAVDNVEVSLDLARSISGVEVESEVELRAWGERSAYLRDPFGNPLCLVQAGTEFTGGAFVS